jgi:transposase
MNAPQNINDIDGDYVMNYCKSQGQESVDWLKEVYARPKKKDKNGIERAISFIEVRNEFARKYFPHLAPKKKSRKKTIKDMLDNL